MNQHAVASVPPPSAEPGPRSRRATKLWLCLGLIVVTAAVYAPVRHYGIICFDDPLYVFENPYVVDGLTWKNFVHAMSQPEAGTWEHPAAFFAPLTALSHILIAQFFGLDPGAHHLGNVVFHVLNTLLLFALLTRMTAQPWRSAWVAALFALHPLHVESVAWIAERKDVTSTLFWMLTALAYVSYTRRPGARSYALVLAAYLAALLCKPMVATQPFVLLLLDVWPLRRLAIKGVPAADDTAPLAPARPVPLTRLVVEKLPLIVLGAIAGQLAVFVQAQIGIGNRIDSLLGDRIANAVVAYVAYLSSTLWPTRLAAPYPFTPLPAWLVVADAALLLGITVLALWGIRRRPYLIVGWLWYLGILLPAIGIAHNLSMASRADRYTYVPAIGIFIILAWGIPDLLARWRHHRLVSAAAGVAALAACLVLTTRQLPIWHDSVSLFGHTVTVTPENLVANFVVGNELLKLEQPERAWDYLLEAARIGEQRMHLPAYWERRGPIEPYYSGTLADLGLILMRRGEPEMAKRYDLAALSMDPGNGKVHTRLGMILAAQGDTSGALAHYREAVRVEPKLAAAHNNLAITLENMGQLEEATAAYAEGVRLEPQNAESRCNWAAALAKSGHTAEAIEQFRIALQLKPQLAEAHFGLASAYAQAGRARDAVAELDALLRARPDSPAVEMALAWLLATADDARIRDGGRALQLAEDADRRTEHDDPDALNALAAAYAETGRFSEAAATAERALAAAQRKGQTALLDALPARLAQYRAGQPVRDRR